MQLDVPGLQTMRNGTSGGKKIRELVALETNAFRIGRQVNAECFEACVLDLILQIRGDLDHGLVDGGMLETGNLNPRSHPFDVQREAMRRLQNTKGKHTFLFDAGFLRIELGEPFT